MYDIRSPWLGLIKGFVYKDLVFSNAYLFHKLWRIVDFQEHGLRNKSRKQTCQKEQIKLKNWRKASLVIVKSIWRTTEGPVLPPKLLMGPRGEKPTHQKEGVVGAMRVVLCCCHGSPKVTEWKDVEW